LASLGGMGHSSSKPDRRRRCLVLVALGCALAAATPALGADREVSISGFAFAPGTVNVDPGDTVTWRWAGPDTNHSVTAASGQEESFDSDPAGPPLSTDHPPGDTFTHTFTRLGTFRYSCKVHPTMTGRVVVGDVPENPPPGGNPPPAGDRVAPSVRSLRVRPGAVCARRTRGCPNTRALLRFTLSEQATLRGKILRGARTVRSFAARRRAGARQLRLPTGRLAPGRYRVRLVAIDGAGNASAAARAAVRVRRP